MNAQGHYFSAREALELRPLTVRLAGAERSLVSARGIFSADSLDKATAILLDNLDRLPHIPEGARIVDVGCGWGPLALTCALRDSTASVLAVDVNEHAREVTRRNAKLLGLTNVRVAAPEDVSVDEPFDYLISNPPIRIGKAELHALLSRWVSQLEPRGAGALVVGKNLGADSLAAWLQDVFPEREVSKAHSSKGFRLLAIRG